MYVMIWQLYKRHLIDETISWPRIMFPNIQHCHADEDLVSCLKYLLNYGFYKFGVEVGKYRFADKCNETSVLNFPMYSFPESIFHLLWSLYI
jgi:hypothetical protein